MKWWKYILSLIFSLIFLITGLITIPDYGINWDEPAHYLRGQSLLRFFLTGKKDYSDFPKIATHYGPNWSEPIEGTLLPDDSTFRRSIYQFDRNGDQFTFPYWERQIGSHPPLNGLLASATNYVLYQKLGIVGDIESYHVFIVAASALLVFLVVSMTTEWYGMFSGVVAGLSLMLYPIFFGESHVNIKDPVETAFYASAIYGFYKIVTTKKIVWGLLASISVAVALGTKFNIVFAPLTLVAWFVCYLFDKKKKWHIIFSRSLWMAAGSALLLSFLLLWLIWPSLWGKPIQGFLQVLNFYRDIGYGTTYQPSSYITLFGFNMYPSLAVIFATPLVILFLSLVGILYTIGFGWKEKNKTSFLVLFWFLVPIARVSLPHTSIYAGVRQIMEYIPAMAILTGIGAKVIADRYKKLKLTIFLLFIPILVKLVSMHPYENVYFNPLIGGLKGAASRNFPDWGVTLGTVYRQGVEWLNKNAEPNARLTLVKGLNANIPRHELRQDILLLPNTILPGEYIMEVIDYYWVRDVSPDTRAYLETLHPVYEVRVENVPILKIWKS